MDAANALAGSAPVPPATRCARLLRLMLVVVSGRTTSARMQAHRHLARAWGLDDTGAERLRQALVLCADHEFNASSFTARCIASTGSDADASVVGALAALSGPRHGNATGTLEQLWEQSLAAGARARSLQRLIAATLQPNADQIAARSLIGFGHPLYPEGDPRATAILSAMPRAARNERLIAAVRDRTGQHPSVDYALVALRRSLGLPRGHAYLIFALGRTVGWLAHFLEQSQDSTLIRPRAAYIGERPFATAVPAPAGISSRVIRRR